MKWQIENVSVHSNILENKEGVGKDYQEPIGIGFPHQVAFNIVKKHNEAVENLQKQNTILLNAVEKNIVDLDLDLLIEALEKIKEHRGKNENN